MNEKKLSQRLECVASFLLPGKRLADIGSDHAYLPCYAYLKGVVPFAIAGEVNEGPFLSAKELVNKLGLSDYISVRLGNGLSVVENGEVQQITIAGMGGGLIRSILEKGKTKLNHAERLILQPNVAADNVRRWLYNNHWKLIHEEILEEDKKIYEVLVAEPGKWKVDRENIEKTMMFGPYLLKDKNEAFQKKWQIELEKSEFILANLNNAARSDELARKKNEVFKQIKLIKEVLS
ncbi:tRNA (adenine(22)-N(1))-methyltransferase TrmK [Pueribacillus theae]|uniref:tRNA (Adenine(22)-N(1))-methyltransferase TrmK n=1 Tax=Pueribacillus theae TaxID=2171751 RepID=A0A2U1K5B5_9BACI|nr:tRNA (adenine(22)-N(1))-methyltransferase TrmK [Pueribacillus theae]PWA12455.1 tRNA (adenine(22)-N(1))-methyltransferase TrmK [Pueribacillus theae]